MSQLAALVQAQVEYHTRAAEILTQLSSKMDERSVVTLPAFLVHRTSPGVYIKCRIHHAHWWILHLPLCRIRETSNKPRKEYTPKPRPSMDFSISENHNGGIHGARSPGKTRTAKLIIQKHVQKLFLVMCVGVISDWGPSEVSAATNSKAKP